jgi:hypothetical protein
MQTVDLQFDPHTYKSCIGFGLKKLKITKRKRGDDSRFQEKKGCSGRTAPTTLTPRTAIFQPADL